MFCSECATFFDHHPGSNFDVYSRLSDMADEGYNFNQIGENEVPSMPNIFHAESPTYTLAGYADVL